MGTFARYYVGLYSFHFLYMYGEDKEQKKEICTVSGLGGSPVYAHAAGPRRGFVLTNPVAWDSGAESLGFDASKVQVQEQCLIEDLPNAELKVGDRVYRLAEATSGKCNCWDFRDGFVRYNCIFQDVAIVVEFYVKNPERLFAGMAGWSTRLLETKDPANPSNFTNKGTTPVTFREVVFMAGYMSDKNPSDDEAEITEIDDEDEEEGELFARYLGETAGYEYNEEIEQYWRRCFCVLLTEARW